MTSTDPRAARGPTTVALYCRRSTAAIVPLDRLYSRLTVLREAGAVTAVDVTTWPGQVTLTGTDLVAVEELAPDDRERAVRRYREFEAWADRVDVSLEPAFRKRSYDSIFTGESGVAIRFPVIALAVREDGDLRAVYPHHDDRPVTVDEGAGRLASRVADAAGLDQPRALGE